ncbi:MAG: sulfotransferase domain-containing protein, partial [Halanaerobiales bacterium]
MILAKKSQSKVKYYLKKILNLMHVHKNSSKKDIFIFSSFRSGSTWLAEIIKSQPGIKFPISPNKIEFLPNIDSYYKKIKPRPYYIKLNSREKNILKKYIQKTSSAEIVYGRRYIDIFKKNHSFVTDRSVFRLLRSNYLYKWFDTNFDIYKIFLIRHPIAASISRKKIWENSSNPSYWSPNNKYFLNSKFFCKNHLTTEQKKYLENKVQDCSLLEKFIISWCLENLSLIKKVQNQNNNFIFLTYEDLLINSNKILNFLSDNLNLPDIDKMKEQLKIPSSTVRYSENKTKNNFENHSYNKNYLLSKWKQKVDNKMEKRIFDILKQLNINIYREN